MSGEGNKFTGTLYAGGNSKVNSKGHHSPDQDKALSPTENKEPPKVIDHIKL